MMLEYCLNIDILLLTGMRQPCHVYGCRLAKLGVFYLVYVSSSLLRGWIAKPNSTSFKLRLGIRLVNT